MNCVDSVIEGLTSAQSANDMVFERTNLKCILNDCSVDDTIDFDIDENNVKVETSQYVVSTTTVVEEWANNSSLAVALMMMTSFVIAANM